MEIVGLGKREKKILLNKRSYANWTPRQDTPLIKEVWGKTICGQNPAKSPNFSNNGLLDLGKYLVGRKRCLLLLFLTLYNQSCRKKWLWPWINFWRKGELGRDSGNDSRRLSYPGMCKCLISYYAKISFPCIRKYLFSLIDQGLHELSQQI